ncbi:MAG TPA: HAMP domain-containing sensor histidine kinase [Gemmataceae bacterium]|jgi:signal transduction histidine kinase
MTAALRARSWGLLVYLLIAALVIGGLGWVTAATLRLELSDQMRLALWRLDSRVSPALAREDSRPFQHYDALYVPLPAMQKNLYACPPGTVWVPSPLLNAGLPDWMLLHFQTTAEGNWRSPQVLNQILCDGLCRPQLHLDMTNVTPARAELLGELKKHYAPANLLARLPEGGDVQVIPADPAPQQEQQVQAKDAAPNQPSQQPSQGLLQTNPDNDYGRRAGQKSAVRGETTNSVAANNGINFNLVPFGEEIPWAELGGKWSGPGHASEVRVGELKPLWLRADGQPERLVLARLASSGKRRVVQGVILDWPHLRDILLPEIQDLFPDARLEPVPEGGDSETPERQMTALPVQLDPGPQTWGVLRQWSPLRVGLLLAWAAALSALAVVGLGGWSLLDLSERRFRFVSAVTHELRTPLTTLRLYLDMLNSGLVRDEPQKAEYLKTLDSESDRLHRLVSNVLDFARLEKQRPKLSLREVPVTALLEQVRANWQERCKAAGKELIVATGPGCPPAVTTDVELVQQIVGNLIDNACKYSRDAADGRVWLRARPDGRRWVALEVEDRGPGVPARERRGVFRAFRRGRSADVTAGGVGLGLALARRWTRLLRGKLLLRPGRDGAGACFQLWLKT